MADFALLHYRTNEAAAKAGILGLIKSLARKLGVRNICVKAVSPGLIEADITTSLPEKSRKEIL